MTPDQFAQALSQSGQVGSVFADVRRAKALSVVLEAATVVDEAGDPVELAPEPEATGEVAVEGDEVVADELVGAEGSAASDETEA
jgi:trigger factor